MQYLLTKSNGTVCKFYILECAELFKSVYGGTIEFVRLPNETT